MQMQLMLQDRGQGKPAFLRTLTNDKVSLAESGTVLFLFE